MRLLSWIDNAAIALGVLIVLTLAPLAAVYEAVTGRFGGALVCVALFVVMLVVAFAKARDALAARGRPERRSRRS